MSGKLVRIWNASSGIVKFGPNNQIMYPADSLIVPEKDANGILFGQNKLVIVEEIVDVSQAETPKRKKKETKEEVSEQSIEVVSEDDNSVIEDNHSTDDSILPESSS